MPNFGVNNSMKSFLLRFRWAIVLAVLQGTAFGTAGLIEHQRSIAAIRNPSNHLESFGCLHLSPQPLPKPLPWELAAVDCWSPLKVKLVVLTNFPLFVIWSGVAELTDKHVDQVRLFYILLGVGIPLFWFWMGSLIDRRQLKGNIPPQSVKRIEGPE
jgi:hypothetical protein